MKLFKRIVEAFFNSSQPKNNLNVVSNDQLDQDDIFLIRILQELHAIDEGDQMITKDTIIYDIIYIDPENKSTLHIGIGHSEDECYEIAESQGFDRKDITVIKRNLKDFEKRINNGFGVIKHVD